MEVKLRVVFDTGIVLQAALHSSGPAGRLIMMLDQDRFALYSSDECIAEYQDVLSRYSIRRKNPHLTDALTNAIVKRVQAHSTCTVHVPAHYTLQRDPNDEHVVNLAIEVKAHFLISRERIFST